MADKRQSEQRIRELSALADERGEELRQLAMELTRVQQEERRHLAKVLHDELQQLLAAAKMRLSLASSRIPGEESRALLNGVGDLIGQSIDFCRTLTSELSPTVLNDSSLVQALEWLGESMQEKHGLAVTIETDSAREPTNEVVRLLVFEAARELLFNVVKHAGTKAATLSLGEVDGNRLRLVVADGGPGFDPALLEQSRGNRAFGLAALRKRLQLLGGSLGIESAPGQATQMAVEIPL